MKTRKRVLDALKKGWRICWRTLKKRWVLWPTVTIFLFYMGFVNYTEPTQLGVARNLVTGEMWAQETGGFHLTPPWVWVACIDLRPMRVAVTSAGHGYSGKLVQFNRTAWREFVAVEGWRFWWWSNRISFNFGYDEEYRGMKDILRGYAYSAKQYPFLIVLAEYQTAK